MFAHWNNGSPQKAKVRGSGNKMIWENPNGEIEVGKIKAAPGKDLYNWEKIYLNTDNGRFKRDGGESHTKEGDTITSTYTKVWVPLDQIKQTLITEVKQQAGAKILETFPQWKQSNIIARHAELEAIKMGTMVDSQASPIPAREWTAGELIEMVVILSVWDWVKSVRQAEGAYTQAVTDALTEQAAIDVVVNWPEDYNGGSS